MSALTAMAEGRPGFEPRSEVVAFELGGLDCKFERIDFEIISASNPRDVNTG